MYGNIRLDKLEVYINYCGYSSCGSLKLDPMIIVLHRMIRKFILVHMLVELLDSIKIKNSYNVLMTSGGCSCFAGIAKLLLA